MPEFISQSWSLIALLVLLAFFGCVLFILRKRLPIIAEFFEFLRERKLWWMAPIVIFLLLIGFLIIAAGYTPLLYPLF